jgi:hypothetical protein
MTAKIEVNEALVENASLRLNQSVRRLVSSLARTGVSLAVLPINVLPKESQRHIQAAGREATYGVTALMRAVADNLEDLVQESLPESGSRSGHNT